MNFRNAEPNDISALTSLLNRSYRTGLATESDLWNIKVDSLRLAVLTKEIC